MVNKRVFVQIYFVQEGSINPIEVTIRIGTLIGISVSFFFHLGAMSAMKARTKATLCFGVSGNPSPGRQALRQPSSRWTSFSLRTLLQDALFYARRSVSKHGPVRVRRPVSFFDMSAKHETNPSNWQTCSKSEITLFLGVASTSSDSSSTLYL